VDPIEKEVDKLMSGQGGVSEQTPADRANVVPTETLSYCSSRKLLAGFEYDRAWLRNLYTANLSYALMDRDIFIEEFLSDLVGVGEYSAVADHIRHSIGEDVCIDLSS
jgi:hypothetical protein